MSVILNAQPHLYDLHAHLLGMGNAGFWIDTILMDESIMPKHETFIGNEDLRKAMCPLVWDEENSGFIDGEETARFFYSLVKKNVFRKVNGEIIETMERTDGINLLEEEEEKQGEKKFSPVLVKLLDDKIYNDLIHAGLQFEHNFSYDVVLELSDLRKGLGVKDSECEGFVQLNVIEKLGCHLSEQTTKFQHWIVFNAKEQKFKIVYGIQVNTLRQLITVDENRPSEAAKLARAHITNAFSMCDAEGTSPRSVDLHGFHGCFTPEFYPRRFALKDSIYSQRLDILAALIAHIIQRYQTCLPPVTYCELSVSVNDLSRAWILDVLRSVQVYNRQNITPIEIKSEPVSYKIYKAENRLSSFCQLVLKGGFPHLQVAFKGPDPDRNELTKPELPCVTYKFLAGFDRQKIEAPFLVNQDQAVNFLYVTPHKAILSMTNEIVKSKRNVASLPEEQDATKISFDPLLEKLDNLKKCFENKETPWFCDWVVGLDLFGDELGYPYCPFVARPFIKFVSDRRAEGKKYFGVRVHCGENVKFASHENPAYRLFVVHMYIVFRCLLFLQQELKYGIRIGHGIAFDHILGAPLNSSKYRKSSVLMAEMRNNAYYLFQKIAFEVNMTSNEYLLGQVLRQGDYAQILRLKELFDMGAHITLGTDDDGIWAIDQCSAVHPGHQSLAAEYCRAISTKLIDSEDHLKKTFETMKKFCFWNMGGTIQQKFVEDAKKDMCTDAPHMNTVIVHPDIIRLIIKKYGKIFSARIKSVFEKYKIRPQNTGRCERITWTNVDNKLRVAFVCICASQGYNEQDLREEYEGLFNLPKDSEKFEVIYNNWESIYSNFVLHGYGSKLQIKIRIDVKKQIFRIICSTDSQDEDSLKFLDEMEWIETENNICAYIPEVDLEKTKQKFHDSIENASGAKLSNGTLRIFTNTKKYVFSYSKMGNIIYRVNPNPSKRDDKEENFIFVLCDYASAATAAVHLLSEQLSKLRIESIPSEQGVSQGDTLTTSNFQSSNEQPIMINESVAMTTADSSSNSIETESDGNRQTINDVHQIPDKSKQKQKRNWSVDGGEKTKASQRRMST